MNHKALMNRFVWPGIPFCACLVDNIFLWNDENNLFSSTAVNLVLYLSIGISSPARQKLTIALNTAIATSQDDRKQKVVKQQSCQNVCQLAQHATNYADAFYTSGFATNYNMYLLLPLRPEISRAHKRITHQSQQKISTSYFA